MRDCILSSEVKNAILSVCVRVAQPNGVVAAALYGPHICGYADEKSPFNVLLIIHSPRLSLKFHHEPFNESTISFLIIDKKTFERDVEGEWFGGILAENILTPYEPLVNGDYLWNQEVKVKKRTVYETLSNMVLEFPEMSHDLLIKPEHFLFESMTRKAALFPPVTYRFLNVLRSSLSKRNLEHMLNGYKVAVESAVEEGNLFFSHGEYVTVTKEYIDAVQKKRLRITNFFKDVRTGILRTVLTILPEIMNSLNEDFRLYAARFAEKENLSENPIFKLEDSK
ncbi:MAG: hypothetical protein QXH91_00285, partial [Candidatus Bathyarchaeia archaeon]